MVNIFHPIQSAVDKAVREAHAEAAAQMTKLASDAQAVIAKVRRDADTEAAAIAADVKARLAALKAQVKADTPTVAKDLETVLDKAIEAAAAGFAAHGL